MFSMVSPYPILEDESAETMRSDKSDNFYVYETQSSTLMSSSNAKPITREGYTLLIDSGFPKRTQRNIETSTAKAIAYFNDVFDEKSPIHFTIAVTRSKRWHTNGWVSGRHTVMALSPATHFMRQWDKSRSSYIILHEIAHLYQGLHPINQSKLLIEGGATAMAYTAEYEQGYINKYVFDLKWHNAQNRCIKSLNKQNSQSFDFDRVKKEHKRLHYDCGAVLFHYIILAHPGLTPYELWKRLHYTNAHSRFSLGVRVAIALDEVYVPNTLFLNELDAFIKDPISEPSGSLKKLKTLATHSTPLTHSVH